jgi:REP-associated tyrosine transposase
MPLGVRHLAAMSNYRRVRVPGGTYFFTVNLFERRRCLLLDRIGDLRAAFRATQAVRPFEILAIVILPDHLHCLWRLPPADSDNTNRWAQIKSGFSRRLHAGERRRQKRVARRERGIWQRRYWEHLIRDDNDLCRHVEYIHFNPVKRGYSPRAIDWPHSSFLRWVERGEYPADWGV